MEKAKFWLVQIAMVAIVSLVFGSPVFADPGKGVEMKNANGTAQDGHANANAGFVEDTSGGTGGEGECAEADMIQVATFVDGVLVITWECP